MTWKSTAVVSGATVLVGWLASSPPSNAPSTSAPAQAQASAEVPTAPSDIEQQAMRLQARLRQEAVFREPERNPFRFGAPRLAARSAPEPTIAPPVETAPQPPVPSVSLSGIAEDQVGERVERTAILSSPSGVLLVREGDEVLGQYRVVKIDSDAVELVKLVDTAPLRLTLKP